MAVQGLVVSVTTDPVVVAGSGIHGVITVHLRSSTGGAAYLGGSTAMTTDGYPVPTSDPPTVLTLGVGEILYATAASTLSLDVVRTGGTTA